MILNYVTKVDLTMSWWDVDADSPGKMKLLFVFLKTQTIIWEKHNHHIYFHRTLIREILVELRKWKWSPRVMMSVSELSPFIHKTLSRNEWDVMLHNLFSLSVCRLRTAMMMRRWCRSTGTTSWMSSSNR